MGVSLRFLFYLSGIHSRNWRAPWRRPPDDSIRSLTARIHVLDLLLKRGETPVARRLTRRIVLHRHEELGSDDLHRGQQVYLVHVPVIVGVRTGLGLLEGIAAQIDIDAAVRNLMNGSRQICRRVARSSR